MNRSQRFKNKILGFSLVEVLMSASLLAVCSLGVAVISKNFFKIENNREQNLVSQDVMNVVSMLFEKEAVCKVNFNGKNLSNGSLSTVYNQFSTPIFQTGQYLSKDVKGRVTLQSISWVAPTPLGYFNGANKVNYNYGVIQPIFNFKRGSDPTPISINSSVSVIVTSLYPNGASIVDCYRNATTVHVDPSAVCQYGSLGISVTPSTMKIKPVCSRDDCFKVLTQKIQFVDSASSTDRTTYPLNYLQAVATAQSVQPQWVPTPGKLCKGIYDIKEAYCSVYTDGGCPGDNCAWSANLYGKIFPATPTPGITPLATSVHLSSATWTDGPQDDNHHIEEYESANLWLIYNGPGAPIPNTPVSFDSALVRGKYFDIYLRSIGAVHFCSMTVQIKESPTPTP